MSFPAMVPEISQALIQRPALARRHGRTGLGLPLPDERKAKHAQALQSRTGARIGTGALSPASLMLGAFGTEIPDKDRLQANLLLRHGLANERFPPVITLLAEPA